MLFFFFLMIRRPPRSTQSRSSAASDVYKRQVLAAVIFNAIIIPLLIPLALHGVSYRPSSAVSLLKRNMFIYGLGGLALPFLGIKLIDMVIVAFKHIL